MGLIYKACNEVMDDLADKSLASAAGESVSAPWGVELNDMGKCAAVVSAAGGLGVARFGDRYKFYVSRRFAGWWGFETWSLLRTVIVAVFLALLAVQISGDYRFAILGRGGLGRTLGYDPELIYWSIFYLSAVGVLLFFARGLRLVSWQRAEWLTGGSVKAGAACVSFGMLALSLGGLWGSLQHIYHSASPIGFFGGLEHFASYTVNFYSSLVDSLYIDLFKKPYLIPLYVAVVLPALCGIAMFMNLACFRFISANMVLAEINQSAARFGRVGEFRDVSGLPELAASSGLGVFLCGGFYLLVVVCLSIGVAGGFH